MTGADQGLVSIVITCYNQARFLGDAIASVEAQTYQPLEILVIDDGSTDDTSRVAAAHPNVRYMRQRNQGPSAARNTGLRESIGPYVVFLDADDRLLPHAIETGLSMLTAHPECAYVSGHYCLIAADGSLLSRWPRRSVDPDPYAALLHHNHIGMFATVMWRRTVLDEVGGFNPALPSCEDYDVLLRTTRRHPTFCYDTLVAEYRRHDSNKSGDPARMLRWSLTVHRSQWKYVRRHPRYRAAYWQGKAFWQQYYGNPLIERMRARTGEPEQIWLATRDLVILGLYYPKGFAAGYREVARALFGLRTIRTGLGHGVQSLGQVRRVGLRVLPLPVRRWIRRLKRFGRPARPPIDFGSLRRIRPVSTVFGLDRGLPIDRFYIGRFLARHTEDICGHVLEFGHNAYARAFGGSRVRQTDVLHVGEGDPEATIIADLTRADHTPADEFDCVICPQTLHLIYDVRAAVGTLYRILKPGGGVVLAMVPGISQNEWRDQWCWSFTALSARRLFDDRFPAEGVAVDTYGNVLTATAFLYGLAAEELREHELAHHDPHYQDLIAIRSQKPGASDP